MSRDYFSEKDCSLCDGSGKQYSHAKINAALKASGLSWQQVTKALKISESYLSHLRAGRKPWKVKLVKRLERILNK